MNTLVIKFHDDVPESVIDLILDNYQADRVHSIGGIRWHKLVVEEGQSERIVEELRADPAVKHVFINRPTVVCGSLTPDDPYFSSYYSDQWQLRAMSLPRAWEITQGDPSTIISLGDTKFQPDHPDFKDSQGVSRFLEGINTYVTPPSSEITIGNNPHGINTSGVGAATGNNAQGVAGINWKCKIVPIKISNNTNGAGTPYSTALSITEAADRGSRLHNLSFNLDDPDPTGEYLRLYQDAIDYALTGGSSGSNGCVVVLISGNNGTNVVTTQDALRRLIVVGASTRDGHRCDYSNFGSWVTCVVPVGGAVKGYTYRTIDYGTKVPTTSQQGTYVTDFWGTSAGAPMEWGNASLAVGVAPNLTPYQLMALMKYAVDKLDARWHDELFSAFGQSNAYKGVKTAQLALSGAAPRPTVIMATPLHNSSVYVGANSTVEFEALVFDENPVESVSLYVNGSNTPHQTVTQEPYICSWPATTPGTYTFQLKAISASGIGASEINTVKVLPAVSAAPPHVGIIYPRSGESVSGSFDVAAAASTYAVILPDPYWGDSSKYSDPYIVTMDLRVLSGGTQIAGITQVTTGGIYGTVTLPPGTSGNITVEATAVTSNGFTATQSIELNVVAPAPLKFVVQPSVLETADDSVIIGYGTADTSADDAATNASALASVTDRLTIREAASAIVTAGVSATDARRMVEAVTATAQSAVSVTATVQQVEQLLAQIDAFPTVSDIMTIAGQIAGVPFIFTSQPTLSMSTGDGGVIAYGTADTGAEDVASAATATAQISEVVQSLEGLVSTVAAIPSVADVLSQLETVASAAQVQASVVDEAVKGIAEDLATTATALADVADLQLMVDNLTVMAESGASLEELAAYTDAVTSAAVMQDSVADVLRSRDAIRYFLASICSPRNFADTASPRIFSSQCSPGRA